MSAESPENQNPPSETSPTEQPTETPETEPEQQPAEVMPGASEADLRAEVRRLRDEAAEHRVRSKRADTLAERLVTAYAAQTRRLADPTDLWYTPDLLDDDGLPDPAKVEAAVEGLLTSKPHLASRTPRGDVGQGRQGEQPEPGLLDLMRG